MLCPRFRSFYNFLLLDGKIAANPLADIEIPRFSPPIPKALSQDEMTTLLDPKELPEGHPAGQNDP